MTVVSVPHSPRGSQVARSLLTIGLAAGASLVGGFAVASGARGFVIATGVVIVSVAFLSMATRPHWGAYALIGVVPAVSGLGRGYPVPAFRLSEALTVSIGALLVGAAILRRERLEWTRFDSAAALYAGTALVTGVVDVLRGSPGGFSPTNLGTIVGPVQFVLLYLAIKITLHEASERRIAVGLLIFSNVVVALFGLAQSAKLFGLDTTLPRITESTVTATSGFVVIGRVTSLFPQWQMLSAFEYIVLILTANLLIRRSFSGPARIGAGIAAGLTAVCLVETVTLTTSAAAVLAILVLSVWNQKFTRAFSMLVVAAGTLGIIFAGLIEKRYTTQYTSAENGLYTGLLPHSFSFRIHIWLTEWVPIISNHLLTGIGPMLPTGGIWTSTESLYVTLLLRGGVPLLASYAVLMVAWFGMARRASQSEDRIVSGIGQVLVVAVVLLVPMQFSEPYFVDTGFPQVLWALTAVAATASLKPNRPTAETAG